MFVLLLHHVRRRHPIKQETSSIQSSNIPRTFRPPQPMSRRNHDGLPSHLSAGLLSAVHTSVDDALPVVILS
ncbi:hypothetical protein BV22DRAFT_891725 [Leucogyrophana mollusca]|uniref:Uncharacterized protein n=1 Tax=Leucogyrophana mollusca TaxID=85980 RepID=A0ACB8B230_9AGAM|nr:hypothetical protein BV22DRAFT_891725 [Leucogyrophana mollusca]